MYKPLSIFFLVVLLFLFKDRHLQGQTTFKEGYVITNTGDTVKGQVDWRQWAFNPDHILFRTSAGNNETFKPGDIREFHIKNEEYFISAMVSLDLSDIKVQDIVTQKEARTAKDTTLFLSVIVKAKTSLYFFKDVDDREHYYVQKQGSPMLELLLKKSYKGSYENSATSNNYVVTVELFKGQLIVLFADCIQVKNDINISEYNTRSLKKLILKYNECIGESPAYIVKPEKMKVRIGIVAGPFWGTLKFSGAATVDVNGAEFNPYFSGTAGVALHLILPRQRAQWDIINELVYEPYRTSGTKFMQQNSLLYYNYSFTFDLAYVKLNTMLRYLYPKWNVRPFGNIGMTNAIAIKTTNTKTVERHYYNVVTTKTGNAIDEFRTYELGFFGGAGVQWKHLGAEVRYEWSNGMSGYAELISNVSTLYLLLSYTF
jgi:hypothetical protein